MEFSFDFSALLPELQGELVERMAPHSAALFALTSKQILAKFQAKRRSSFFIALGAAGDGEWVLSELIPLYNQSFHLLQRAISSRSLPTIRYLLDHPLFFQAQDNIDGKVPGIAYCMGLQASISTYQLINERFIKAGKLNPFHPGLMAEAAASESNEDLLLWELKELKIAAESEKAKIKVLKAVLGSGNDPLVRQAAEILQIPLGRSKLEGVVVDRIGMEWTASYVRWLVQDLGVTIPDIILANALYFKYNSLVQLLLDFGVEIPPLEIVAFLYQDPSQREVFELFLAHPRVKYALKVGETPCDLDYGKLGIPFLAEKGIFDSNIQRCVTEKTHPSVLLFLRSRGCEISDSKLFTSAIWANDVALVQSLLDSPGTALEVDVRLFWLTAKYKAWKVLQFFLERIVRKPSVLKEAFNYENIMYLDSLFDLLVVLRWLRYRKYALGVSFTPEPSINTLRTIPSYPLPSILHLLCSSNGYFTRFKGEFERPSKLFAFSECIRILLEDGIERGSLARSEVNDAIEKLQANRNGGKAPEEAVSLLAAALEQIRSRPPASPGDSTGDS